MRGIKIAIIVEGQTERVFKESLLSFLKTCLPHMPKLQFITYNGRIPKQEKLKRVVEKLLEEVDHVIALTDVFTGPAARTLPDFINAEDAKSKMRRWVGDDPRFHPHAAQHDFEAWLLPYWSKIQRIARHNKNAPPGPPESINHNKPPAYYIQDIFEIGGCRKSYVKPRDAKVILNGEDLIVAVRACPELKAFINTIISACEGEIIS